MLELFVLLSLVRLEADLGRDYKFRGGPVGGSLFEMTESPGVFADYSAAEEFDQVVRLPLLGATINAEGSFAEVVDSGDMCKVFRVLDAFAPFFCLVRRFTGARLEVLVPC